MSQIRILVVDDNQDLAEILADILDLNGFYVDIAYDGESAIEQFRKNDYDLAFMDVKLPGMNGVESFLQIRKIKPNARVIMMTGFSVEHLLDEAVRHGAWAVMHKPLEIPKVLDMLENMGSDGVVLVADDDPFFSQMLREVLSKQGYQVLLAHDGNEVLEQIQNQPIDLLILDLQMPVLSGLEVYVKLKKMDMSVPTIIITGHATEENTSLDYLRDMAVSGILTKPFHPEVLIGQISQILAMKKE